MTNNTFFSDVDLAKLLVDEGVVDGVTTYDLRIARAAIQAVLQTPEIQHRYWQTIETAPKDGTVVDLWADGERVPDMRWYATSPKFPSGYWCSTDGRHWAAAECIDATHWMLPPSPPVDAAMGVKP